MTADPTSRPGREPVSSGRPEWLRALIGIALMLLVYFVIPFGQDDDPLPLVVAGLIALVGAMGMAFLIGRQIVEIFASGGNARLAPLAVLFAASVFVFSISFFILERSAPGQVPDLDTRLDSLYMTMVTLATIGYGDLHPEGQMARGLACIQIAFNLVVVTVAVKTFSFGVQSRMQRRSQGNGSDRA
jgi:voltage-gated potassium channel